MILEARGRRIDCSNRSLVMGIVNVTDDSFSGDGTLDVASALQIAARQVAAGADIIDVGAESARTNRPAISIDEEIRRLEKFLSSLGDIRFQARWPDQIFPPLLSINTWRPEVVQAVLPLGGDLLNDIGAIPDAANAQLCARHGAALVIMHSVGEPKIPRTDVDYADVWAELEGFFAEKIALALAAGMNRNRLVLDPGIDFAKQRPDNLRIYRDLVRLRQFDRPILLAVSRKTVVGEVLGLPDPVTRDAGTIACLVAGRLRSASIFRVHNVRAAASSLRIADAVTSARETKSDLRGHSLPC
jgi:dihydropteroate synthase